MCRLYRVNFRILIQSLYRMLFPALAIAAIIICAGDIRVYAADDENGDSKAGGYALEIVDDAGLLSDEECAEVRQEMNRLVSYGNVVFLTTDSNSMTTNEFATTWYLGKYRTENGFLLCIEMANRQIYIYTQGAPYQELGRSYAYTITDNVYSYAADGDYARCAVEAFSQMRTLYEGRNIRQPMRYICAILFASLLSLLINYIIMRKTSKISAAASEDILYGMDHGFNIANVKIDTTDVKWDHTSDFSAAVKEGTGSTYGRRSHSGGTGSSGGGGGSRSSGGGGGHSF